MTKCVILLVGVLALIPGLLQAQTAAHADFDMDRTVAFPDFLKFVGAFGSGQVDYDLNRNGSVDFPDFLIFARFYGQEIAPSSGGNPPQKLTVTLPDEFLADDVAMEFVWIEPGTFIMGTPDSEPGRLWEEAPMHRVTITQGFYVGMYEVTQRQWEAVMGTRPWDGHIYGRSNPDYPAGYLSWDDAQAFIKKLNSLTGFGGRTDLYRLPTEAEWEYAARAGTTTMWSFGGDESRLKEYAWYQDNAWDVGEPYAHRVGQKRPNQWGLYDMYGNVEEWCWDWWEPYPSPYPEVDPTGPPEGRDRVHRGGDFKSIVSSTRSGFRNCGAPFDPYIGLGFRLVRQVQ